MPALYHISPKRPINVPAAPNNSPTVKSSFFLKVCLRVYQPLELEVKPRFVGEKTIDKIENLSSVSFIFSTIT